MNYTVLSAKDIKPTLQTQTRKIQFYLVSQPGNCPRCHLGNAINNGGDCTVCRGAEISGNRSPKIEAAFYSEESAFEILDKVSEKSDAIYKRALEIACRPLKPGQAQHNPNDCIAEARNAFGLCAYCGKGTMVNSELEGEENWIIVHFPRYSWKLCSSLTCFKQSTILSKETTNEIKQEFEPKKPSRGDERLVTREFVVHHFKSAAGRILTLVEAIFPAEAQGNAVKTLIKKEFREQLNRVNDVFYGNNSGNGQSSFEELPEL